MGTCAVCAASEEGPPIANTEPPPPVYAPSLSPVSSSRSHAPAEISVKQSIGGRASEHNRLAEISAVNRASEHNRYWAARFTAVAEGKPSGHGSLLWRLEHYKRLGNFVQTHSQRVALAQLVAQWYVQVVSCKLFASTTRLVAVVHAHRQRVLSTALIDQWYDQLTYALCGTLSADEYDAIVQPMRQLHLTPSRVMRHSQPSSPVFCPLSPEDSDYSCSPDLSPELQSLNSGAGDMSSASIVLPPMDLEAAGKVDVV